MDDPLHHLDGDRPNEPTVADLLEAMRLSEIEMEKERCCVARTLHDEVGGLLVGAVMDMSWISQQSGQSGEVLDKLARAISALRAAIDIERKSVESLRPSLLDDVGLYSTIGWHLKASCDAAGVVYTESYPLNEPALSADFKIGVFRIFQEALNQVLSDSVPSKLSLQLEIIADTLHCRIASHFLESSVEVVEAALANTPLHHRTRQMGGACQSLKTREGNHVTVMVPMAPGHA